MAKSDFISTYGQTVIGDVTPSADRDDQRRRMLAIQQFKMFEVQYNAAKEQLLLIVPDYFDTPAQPAPASTPEPKKAKVEK